LKLGIVCTGTSKLIFDFYKLRRFFFENVKLS